MVRLRVRVDFNKEDDLRFIGHRDLIRCFERLFRRAGIPLSLSEGFHPKPRMTFPLPLAVGIEGHGEVMDLEVSESFSVPETLTRLQSQAPSGLTLRALEFLPPGAKKPHARRVCYQASIPGRLQTHLVQRINELMARASLPITRKAGRPPVDLRSMVEELTLQEDRLCMRLRIDQQGSIGPRDVLKALGLEELELLGGRITRTALEMDV
ncbi:MAG: TIGR03936 family radical SAM-associated protein [Thermoguttaceae bacterium]